MALLGPASAGITFYVPSFPDLSVPSGTASLAWTEQNDTSAATITSSSAETLSWTEANDASAETVTSASSETLSWTEQNDTNAATVGASATASAAWTEANDLSAGTAASSSTVALAWTDQNDGGTVTVTAAVENTQNYSGGHFHFRSGRTKEEEEERIRRSREKFGVIPKRVQAVIKKTAAKEVKKEQPNTDAAQLEAAFLREQIAYEQFYASLYRDEVIRQLQEIDDDEAMLLLM